MLPIFVLPVIVAASKNYFEDVTKVGAGDASLLVLSEESKAALLGALIGILVVLAVEIALIVLKATLCKDVSTQDMADVMCGIANADFAPVAEAPEEAFAEEAPAEEAVTEEALTEEESPVEEAPTEEVPAMEETTDEEENTEA